MLTQQIDLGTIIEALRSNMRLDQFEEHEISSVLKKIFSFRNEGVRLKIAVVCQTLSRISSTLIPKSIKHIQLASGLLEPEDLVKWLDSAVGILDSSGIREFVEFMVKTKRDDLRSFMSPEFLNFSDTAGTLQLYLRGISGSTLSIATDPESFTDTGTVFVPTGISRYRNHDLNFTLYEFMIAHKWAEISLGTLLPAVEASPDIDESAATLDSLFETFSDRELAIDLYVLLEAFLIEEHLTAEFPGLMSRVERLKGIEYAGRPEIGTVAGKTSFVEAIYQLYLGGAIKGRCPPGLTDLLSRIPPMAHSQSPEELLNLFTSFYAAAGSASGEYLPERPLFFFGTMRPERISLRLRENRREKKREVDELIRKLLRLFPLQDLRKKPTAVRRNIQPEQDYVLLGQLAVEADQDLKEAVRQGLPGASIVSGREIKADTIAARIDDIRTDFEGEREPPKDGFKYDEWDYRRGAYRRQWCTVFETESARSDEPFVQETLNKYGGVVKKLRGQFELLRPFPQLTRRNKEGDLIDLDAAIEAYTDFRAGIFPDENLYFRIERKSREIAVLFLVDMSDSTKGWVNNAEKEALVLMCEAIEKLGDRYAIAGFSGNTRYECIFFRIKHFTETYSETVRKRIAGILPKDYTRIGPAVRHSVHTLSNVDARKKLLVVISDGKPQDIGEYGGDYGIEDTRMALLEAKAEGIFPICVTLDKEAASYIPHMYGEVNYFIIDDPGKLPHKLAEVYRRLTT